MNIDYRIQLQIFWLENSAGEIWNFYSPPPKETSLCDTGRSLQRTLRNQNAELQWHSVAMDPSTKQLRHLRLREHGSRGSERLWDPQDQRAFCETVSWNCQKLSLFTHHHELNKNTHRHAKGDEEKVERPRPYTKNHKHTRNSESKRNSPLRGIAQEMVN